jgi:hypothetical protein
MNVTTVRLPEFATVIEPSSRVAPAINLCKMMHLPVFHGEMAQP